MVINLGIIGYGYWGPNLTRNFHELPECKIKYICDLDHNKLNKAKIKYPEIKLINDHTIIFKDKSIDGVVIATPVSTHYWLAKEAINHGKDVMVEKPICTSISEAENLVELSEKKKKIILVGHTLVYNPAVIKIKEFINQKLLGKIYYIDSSRVNLGLFQPDVSVVWDLAPHDLAVILYWLNIMPQEVSCHSKSFIRHKIHEVAYLTLFFSNGMIAHLHMSWLSPCKLRRTAVVGSKRMIIFDDTESVEKVKLYKEGVIKNIDSFGEYHLAYRSGDIISPRLEIVEPLKVECINFLDCIKNRTTPKSDAKFSLNIVKILKAADISTQNRGEITKI